MDLYTTKYEKNNKLENRVFQNFKNVQIKEFCIHNTVRTTDNLHLLFAKLLPKLERVGLSTQRLQARLVSNKSAHAHPSGSGCTLQAQQPVPMRVYTLTTV
jgi:hypothetical protein